MSSPVLSRVEAVLDARPTLYLIMAAGVALLAISILGCPTPRPTPSPAPPIPAPATGDCAASVTPTTADVCDTFLPNGTPCVACAITEACYDRLDGVYCVARCDDATCAFDVEGRRRR